MIHAKRTLELSQTLHSLVQWTITSEPLQTWQIETLVSVSCLSTGTTCLLISNVR